METVKDFLNNMGVEKDIQEKVLQLFCNGDVDGAKSLLPLTEIKRTIVSYNKEHQKPREGFTVTIDGKTYMPIWYAAVVLNLKEPTISKLVRRGHIDTISYEQYALVCPNDIIEYYRNNIDRVPFVSVDVVALLGLSIPSDSTRRERVRYGYRHVVYLRKLRETCLHN